MWRPKVQRQLRTLLGKLVVLQREPRRERAHTSHVFAHAHAGEDGQLLVLLEVRVLHRTTCERCSRYRCIAVVRCSESSKWAGTL